MGPKTILVCLTTVEHADTLMKTAVALARQHDAHLIGLHTIEALVVYPGIAMHIPEPAFAMFNQSQTEEAEKIKAIFDRHTANEDFAGEFRLLRAEAVSANERMVDCARSADLVIMAQEDRNADRPDQRQAQAEVIRDSGRPVIVVPPGHDGAHIGRHILLGWSDTREAARAAHDLVSIAPPDTEVTVLRVDQSPQNPLVDHEGIDISEMLSRHGLRVSLDRRDAPARDIADVLGKVAFEQGADLIVTGAFGHSRAYDFVIGATTYGLLRHAKLPVMFSK